MNWAPVHVPDRELQEVFLHPFEAAVRAGGLGSMMNGYHELDGVPCAANGRLLNAILRGVVGLRRHRRLRLLLDRPARHVPPPRPEQDRGGRHRAGRRDRRRASVQRLLRRAAALRDRERRRRHRGARRRGPANPAAEVRAGPLRARVRRRERGDRAVDTEAQRSLAATVARKSLVLLRNEGVLPLGPAPGVVAVVGPNAHEVRHLLGDYSYPAHIESLVEMGGERSSRSRYRFRTTSSWAMPRSRAVVLEALKARYGDAVRYARGCAVNDDDTSGFAEAVALAAAADVVVLVVGDKAGLTQGCTSGEGRDRSSLALPGVQEDLARAVLATGTPVVTVLVVGRPCGTEELHRVRPRCCSRGSPDRKAAQRSRTRLRARSTPAGSCRSRSRGRSASSRSSTATRSPAAGPTGTAPTSTGATSPLYPFGHGLSYTTFAIADPVVPTPTVRPQGTVTVSASVANVGLAPGRGGRPGLRASTCTRA